MTSAARNRMIATDDPQSETARELRDLRETVQALSTVVGRFVVVLERQLASNDARSESSRAVLAKLHPEMDRIAAEVRAKAGGRKPSR